MANSAGHLAMAALATVAVSAQGTTGFCADKLQQGLTPAPADWPGNTDCRGFFNCWHGYEPLQLCAEGIVFDGASRQCRWPWEVDWQCGVATEPPEPTTAPVPTPAPTLATTPMVTSTAATPSTTTATTAEPVSETTRTTTPETTVTLSTTPPPSHLDCVPQSVLTCVNDYSTYWPKCDPSQSKDNAGPAGYECGYYCTQEWVAKLNEMLSDSAVGKCRDVAAIRNFLAQDAYETGFYSTVYQPRDGGAGLIHMIPNNWPYNARDMDTLWPGNDYEQLVGALGASFFQTSAYGWRSVAAWYKLTNRVIPGCGEDLFDAPYDSQTRCILGQWVDRSEAFNVVTDCMSKAGLI
eukprot:CAMPEP_0117487644 /NCGR_PEP_ID=MMETSP0784-20121206/16101_1 /TAXON_ID=39447 /ORGANISM="" /LENGTH=350 /DNA_ID=CAMNT_0005282297 /DNA_START=65 /DNA_END=1117 /DNA_ORIENTATION=-